jgi:hypothetical protein
MAIRFDRTRVAMTLDDHQSEYALPMPDIPRSIHMPKHLTPAWHPGSNPRCLPLCALSFDDNEQSVRLEASIWLRLTFEDVPLAVGHWPF